MKRFVLFSRTPEDNREPFTTQMSSESHKKDRISAMILAGFMLGTFVISFALQSLLAKFFGASATLDAYTVGNSISFLFIN